METKPIEPFRFENPQHQKIHSDLSELFNAAIADYFRDACQIHLMSDVKTRVHLIFHSLRELESAVRGVLMYTLGAEAEKFSEEKLVEEPAYKSLLELCADLTDEEGEQVDKSEILDKLGGITRGLGTSHAEQVAAISDCLDIPDNHAVRSIWTKLAKRTLFRFAHRDNLGYRSFSKEVEDSWDDTIYVFSIVLSAFRRKYSSSYKRINELIEDTKTSHKRRVTIFRTKLPQNTKTLEHFFEQIQGAEWLPHLKNAGYFKQPNNLQVLADGGVRAPSWPPGKYLIRVAKSESKAVMDVILDADETDNPFVMDDFVDAALVMPPGEAKRIIPVIPRGDTKPKFFGSISDRLSGLVVLLATDVSTKHDAFTCAEILLVRDEHSMDDDYQLGEALKKIVEPLVGIDFEKTLDLLFKAMDSVIAKEKMGQPPDDASYIWRPNLSAARGINRHEYTDLLADNIHLLLQKESQASSPRTSEIIESCNHASYDLARRFRDDYLASLPDEQIDKPEIISLIGGVLDDKKIRDHHYHKEHFELLKKIFPKLSGKEKQRIWKLIDSGPDVDYSKWKKKDADQSIEYWKASRMQDLEEYLPDEKLEEYEALKGKHGEISLERDEMRTFTGPSSPLSAEEIGARTNDSLVEYLKSHEWNPDGFGEPSPEGLGRAIQEAVKKNPGRFQEDIDNFKGVDPTYIRNILLGLREASKLEHLLNWDKLLPFLHWVTLQDCDVRKGSGTFSIDPDWTWAKKEAVHLLSPGLHYNAGTPVDIKNRQLVWKIVANVLEVADPPFHGGEDTNMEPLAASINTARGEAMHTAVHYGLWIARSLSPEEKEKKSILDSVPELRKVLDWHIDVKHDESLAVRSVYGQWLPQIHFLDENWIQNHEDLLFPKEDARVTDRLAVWEAFLIAAQNFRDVSVAVLPQFERAIEDLRKREGISSNSRYEPLNKLSHHIMILRLVDMSSYKGVDLASEFFKAASFELAEEALGFIGRNVFSVDVDQGILLSTKAVWEERILEIEASWEKEKRASEAGKFGWFFASGKFDPSWSLNELHRVLRLTGELEAVHHVLPKLQEMFKEYPSEVLMAVELIAERLDSIRFYYHKELKQILKLGLTHENAGVRDQAIKITNLIISMGFKDFLEILD